MRNIPLSVALSWPTPNYDDPITRGNALLIVNIIFIIIVTLSIVARVYSRFSIQGKLSIADWMILSAYVCTCGMTAVVLLANRHYGWDRHIWDVPITSYESTNLIAFVAKLMFTLASTFTRMSLIAFYYLLVRDSGLMWFKYVLHVSQALNVAVGITFIFLVIFLCVPVQLYWAFPPIPGKCLDEGAVTLVAGCINCVVDFLCAALPIPLIMRLHMPLKQRIGVCALLCVGFFVTIAGIVRTYYIYKSLIASYDETWFTYPLWIAAALEVDIAVICANVPSLKPILWKPLKIWTHKVYGKFSSVHPSEAPDTISLQSREPIYDSNPNTNKTWSSQKAGWDKRPVKTEVRSMNSSGHGTQISRSMSPVSHSRVGVIPSPERRHWLGSPTNSDVGEDLDTYLQKPERLEINKETTVRVSASQRPASSDRDLPQSPSDGSLQYQSRHRTMLSSDWGRDRSAPAASTDWRDRSHSTRASRRDRPILRERSS